MLARRGLALFIIPCVVLSASGLKCWKCENTDLVGCKATGKAEICNEAENESCQTELRYSEDRTVIIKTGCKQGSACSNNNIQNPAGAWAPSQCNEGTRNSVCRCCCNGNFCNRRRSSLMCKLPVVHQTVQNPPAPPKTCDALPKEVENGHIMCSGGVRLRAFCKFTCVKGYKLVGYPTTICVQRGNKLVWNRQSPVCEKEDICKPLPSNPSNGRVKCKGNGEVDTICTFTCDYGFDLDGPVATQCEKTVTGARWSTNAPKCKKQFCNALPRKPENGGMDCSRGKELGSVCSFACDYGHELEGSASTKCRQTTTRGPAEWSHQTPSCKKLKCRYVPREPQNGQKECDGKGELGTVCSFACNMGFQLVGHSSTTCEKTPTKMRWSRGTPKCKPLCKTLPDAPANGFMNCNGDGEVGTVCTFHCKPGSQMKGHRSTTCQAEEDWSGADWTNNTPACQPFCTPLPATPENGGRKCSGSGEIGTLCSFQCDSGYKLIGADVVACEKSNHGAEWDREAPICTPVCKKMPETLEYGATFCNGAGEVGTFCTFECHPGYKRAGASDTTCDILTNGPGWTNEAPLCKPVCEKLPEAPENGTVICNGTGEPGTNCKFSCNGDDLLLSGSRNMDCVNTANGAKWNDDVPRCLVRPVCAGLGDLANGRIACDNPINVEGTMCSFECLEIGFSLVPKERISTVCDASLSWTVRKPCCVDCSTVKKDIMIAMDSSGSISPKEWNDMKRFVQDLLKKFKIGDDAAQFSVFQFSSGARSDGSMYFGRYSKKRLIRQVGNMNRMASGTMTGKALEYARRRFSDTGNRAGTSDMLLVLTDGEAEDTDALWKVSKQLRKDGVEILALAIGPTENFVGQMAKMTGNKEKVLQAAKIADLTDDLADMLFKKTCQDAKECPNYS